MEEDQRGLNASPAHCGGNGPSHTPFPRGSSVGGAAGSSSKAGGCTFVYYVVTSDGDDLKCPNAFRVPKKSSLITLGDVRRYFPLPGTYHFRFRVKVKENPWPLADSSPPQQPFVWLDVTGDDQPLPLCDHRIYVKATRLSWRSGGTESLGGFLDGSRAAGRDSHGRPQYRTECEGPHAGDDSCFSDCSSRAGEPAATPAQAGYPHAGASGSAAGAPRPSVPGGSAVADFLLLDDAPPSRSQGGGNVSTKLDHNIDLIF
ncbi:hypothetical protein BESB_021920 [Besnoitia besnoiti]|uniref:DIX domain-containing protein n=1 Tax=Besnoitia besnoiti TaxID=94643 RepID=A0A2A9M7H2_BESBE|nr:hypothetical protein BESB_021920 [Besnoitia besnoiti]PFH32251.1 hypothetical protein BESB_021920 [Besnoitia besnoiti]